MRVAFHHYLAGLRDEYQSPVIDARDWCPDEEFGDLFHLFASGANTFSKRFGREVYQPLLQGKPMPSNVLLREDVPVTSAPLPEDRR